MKLVDANILLYAVNRDSAHHREIRAWWETNLNGDEPIGLAWIVLLAFLRLATRVFPQPLGLNQATDRIDAWISHPNTCMVSQADQHWSVLRKLINSAGTAGNLTTDAFLAALAITQRATLISCDNDFARFPGLNWENPLSTA